MNETNSPSPYPAEGELIEGKYRVGKMLGSGGMGAVIEATHLLRKAPVALKFMSPDLVNAPCVVDRFFNEGVAASRIANDHVVQVLDVSRLPSGLPYIVMEYLSGEDLAQLVAREGSEGLPDIARAVHIALQVLRGLQAAHSAGIIHRDLKPANCFLITREGEPDFVKIVDFGISKVRRSESANLTMAGSMLGSPLYIAPEQARDSASVDTRADLYGVAIILYELLCGHPPFNPASGQLSELFILVATEAPEPLRAFRSDLPPGLEEVVLQGLAKTPDERHQTPAEMAESLSAFADERSDVVLRQLLPRNSIRTGAPPSRRYEATEALPPQPALAESPSAPLSGGAPAQATRRSVWPKGVALVVAVIAVAAAALWARPADKGERSPRGAAGAGTGSLQAAAVERSRPEQPAAPAGANDPSSAKPHISIAPVADKQGSASVARVTARKSRASGDPATKSSRPAARAAKPPEEQSASDRVPTPRRRRRRSTPKLNEIEIEQ